MKQPRKSTLFGLLFALLLSSLVLGSAQGAPPEDWRIPEGTFPVTEEPVTLRIFAPASASADITTAGFTKWYEEQTGVTIEWMLAPSGQDANQALNLLMASGDYPDVIMYALTPSQQMLYGQQGILIPLNDLIEEHGTWTKKVFEEFPTIEEAVTSPDGTIYGLPEANQCYHCSMAQKMWVYQPWLDALGLEMPTTTEEFQAMLTAFKTQDPNGNGKADEIPLTGAPSENIWNGQMDSFLMNAFTLTPIETDRLTLTDGTVTPAYTQPEFREGLRYLRALYADGLIAPEAFTQTADQLLSQGLQDTVIVGAVNTALSGYVAEWGSERNGEYVVVPPLEGPNGLRTTPFVSVYGGGRFFITSAAENPEVALRFADALYIPEVEMQAIFGKEGVNWRWAEEGEVSIEGNPAVFATLPAPSDTPAHGWDQINNSYRPNWFRLAEVRKNELDVEVVLYEQTKKMEPYAQDMSSAVPPLFFTTEQAQELADLEATITRYVEEMIARFTTGDADIENDAAWDEFQTTLEQMGLPRMLEIYQAAYDASASN
jgi:putative aldouronate transport system substrate-binding protein